MDAGIKTWSVVYCVNISLSVTCNRYTASMKGWNKLIALIQYDAVTWCEIR